MSIYCEAGNVLTLHLSIQLISPQSGVINTIAIPSTEEEIEAQEIYITFPKSHTHK